ncbi:hypothetical protein D9M72_550730 [compost metagenome]
MLAVHHVVLGNDIFALEQPRLAHARLWCKIDHMGIFEARQVGPREIEQAGNAGPPFEFRVGQVFDTEPGELRHVRAVQPDDARQRRLQPPERPASADQTLGLMIDRLELFRFFEFEALCCGGVDPAPAGNGRQDEIAVRMLGASVGSNVEVARCVDHDVTHDGLAAGFRLADHALDRPVLDDRRGEPAVRS